MDPPGDKAHDGQMLDHQPLLFGGEQTVWPRGKDIRRRTAQRLGLRFAVRLGLAGGNAWKWTNDSPEWRYDFRYFPHLYARCSAFAQTRSWVTLPGARTVERSFWETCPRTNRSGSLRAP
jgi:hypothetical protein